MAGHRPRIVVLDDQTPGEQVTAAFGDRVEIVRVKSAQEALELLRTGRADGVYPEVNREAMMSGVFRPPRLQISSREILERLPTGVVIVDRDFHVLWHNRQFAEMCGGEKDYASRGIYDAIGCEEIRGPDFCPFTDCLSGTPQAQTSVRLRSGRHVEISVQNITPRSEGKPLLLCLVRDITSEIQEREKMTAIHRAGLELGHLTRAELADMTTEERVDLLKANILQHSEKILNFRSLEIRLLDAETKRLELLLSEGMTLFSQDRELYASPEGNGVTGFVAATGTSYLCDDVLNDPLYLPGAASARSSLTVPMFYRDRVIGTFNVESVEDHKFNESDREFLEIFAREIAVALHTLELLEAEKQFGGTETVEAIINGASVPVDEIVSDTIRVNEFLSKLKTEDRSIQEAVRRVLTNARVVKNAIQQVGQTVESETSSDHSQQPTRLSGKRVLVVDAEPAIRRSAHVMLGQLGCEVDTAKDGHEAQQLARSIAYDVVVGDIRLPDRNGYEFFSSMRALNAKIPIVLMTGFGYDANHSIVRARQEGLAGVLYKPFRLDRIREAVADALKVADGGRPSDLRRPSSPEMSPKQTIL